MKTFSERTMDVSEAVVLVAARVAKLQISSQSTIGVEVLPSDVVVNFRQGRTKCSVRIAFTTTAYSATRKMKTRWVEVERLEATHIFNDCQMAATIHWGSEDFAVSGANNALCLYREAMDFVSSIESRLSEERIGHVTELNK